MAITSQITRTAFSGDNVASLNYKYSNWLTTRYPNVTVQIGCATLSPPATTVTYRIEGRATPSSDRNASIHLGSFSGVSTIDEYVVITPKYPEMRIGAKVDSITYGSPLGASPLASPTNLYCTFMFSEER